MFILDSGEIWSVDYIEGEEEYSFRSLGKST